METPKPYADAAQSLRLYGLVPIPTGGDDGKTPLVKWPKHPYGEKAVSSLVAKHGSANVGILCGLSGVTVVDIDDPALVPAMLERFGETPLQIQTPSGGVHLWYCANGESNSQRLDGLAVDIRGNNGFVVVPPSVRPSGPHAGKPYTFLTGGWDDLARLPQLKLDSLAPQGGQSRLIAQQGQRNSTLYSFLLKKARACDDLETLIDVANTLNEGLTPPLSDAEVLKTAISAWGYEQRGENWSGKQARAIVTEQDDALLSGHPYALALLVKLRLAHGARTEPFAISAKAMHRENVILGWGMARYRAARDVLLAKGFLTCTFQGGYNKHSPSLYALRCAPLGSEKRIAAPPQWKPAGKVHGSRGSVSKPLARGAGTEPNITKHPSPLETASTAPPTAPKQAELFSQPDLGNSAENQSFGVLIQQA